MAPKLPPIGVRAVVENYTNFNKTIDSVNKRIGDASKKAIAAAKASAPLNAAMNKFGFTLDDVRGKLNGFIQQNVPFGNMLGGILDKLAMIPLPALAAAAAIVGLGAAFVALGTRGAALVGLAQSFDFLSSSVGATSTTLLKDLRQASAGTISDFDLIRRANLALVGSTGEFGRQFGQQLPKILESARAAARATGQDVDFLFNSLVTGIKRGSPLLIDNTGIVLKIGAANEALADSVGKTVEQLSAEEKQIAILNATVAAGQKLIDSLGTSQETNAEKIARAGATITNIFDSLALTVQPAFGVVLDVVNRILGVFQQLVVGIAPIIGAVTSTITSILGGAFNIILDVIQPIINAVTSFLPYISILFQGIATVVNGIATVIGNVVGGIVNFLKDVAKNFFGLDFDNLGPNLFNGAARAFGAFANGIIKVANALIFPAVIGIAQFIADLLIGLSPPKFGPLSTIDKGGENLMLAWLDGIAGVSLDPVEKVAEEVSLALGNIGKASLFQVEGRLAELDKALLPFQNRLEIVKSRFDAIAEPAKAALEAIDRQLAEAEAALATGDQAAAERIRLLDAQRAAIQGNLDAQQRVVDQSQVQLALAQAQQAQERALLNIRKTQLQVTQKVGAAVDRATGKLPAEEKAKAGAAAELPAGVGGALDVGTTTGNVLDLLGGQSAVNDAIAGIQDAFAGEIDISALGDFQVNQGLLQTQLDRIGSVDVGAKLGEKFKGISDLFDPAVEGSPANVVSRFFSPDPGTPGSLAGFVNSIGPTLDGLKADIEARVGEFFDSIFNSQREGSPANIVQTLFADADTPNSIASFFSNLGPNLEAAAPAIKDAVDSALKSILDPETEGSPANFIVNAVKELTGDEAAGDSVASYFKELPTNVSNAASGLFDLLKTNVFDPVTNFLTGQGEGTLSAVLDGVVKFFTELPSRIGVALSGIGASIYSSLVVPIITAINSLIELAEGGVKAFIDNVANFVTNIADALGGVVDTSFIRNVAADLKTKSSSLSFGRISTELPAFLQAPAAARGGLFSDGLVKVGERGPEFIGAASRIGVLPAQLTSVLEGLGSILAQPAPMLVPGGGDTYNNQRSSSIQANFYGEQDAGGVMRRLALLQARGR